MGVTFHEYKFLDIISKNNTFGNILTIGRQELILNKKDKIRLNINHELFHKQKFINNILIDKFKAFSVQSIDNSNFENANIIADLNQPLSSNKNLFDTIIDFGTSEHIFNAAQCLQNISNFCKSGGIILHSLPSNNNCGHGFWQFSPELFFSLYCEENGFSETEIYLFDAYNKYYIWKINKQEPGHRLELASDVSLYLLVKTKKIKQETYQKVQQSDYIFRWDDKNLKSKKVSKKILSFIWKSIKDAIKNFIFKFILPLKLSEMLEGKKILSKKHYSKSKYLNKIKL